MTGVTALSSRYAASGPYLDFLSYRSDTPYTRLLASGALSEQQHYGEEPSDNRGYPYSELVETDCVGRIFPGSLYLDRRSPSRSQGAALVYERYVEYWNRKVKDLRRLR